MNEPREWYAHVYPEDTGGYRLTTGPSDDDDEIKYPRRRVRLIEWPADAPLPVLP